VCVCVCVCVCVRVCTHCLAFKYMFLPVSLHWRIPEEIKKSARDKNKKKEEEKIESQASARRLPDTEVGAAGVVAADGGHSAGVRADVARPGLGDVEGAVRLQPHAGDGQDVDD